MRKQSLAIERLQTQWGTEGNDYLIEKRVRIVRAFGARSSPLLNNMTYTVLLRGSSGGNLILRDGDASFLYAATPSDQSLLCRRIARSTVLYAVMYVRMYVWMYVCMCARGHPLPSCCNANQAVEDVNPTPPSLHSTRFFSVAFALFIISLHVLSSGRASSRRIIVGNRHFRYVTVRAFAQWWRLFYVNQLCYNNSIICRKVILPLFCFSFRCSTSLLYFRCVQGDWKNEEHPSSNW
jgi:hypothetical protein